MQPQPERWTKIEVNIEASNERLLEGLDVWLDLGLISDQEVKRICHQHLSCTIPAVTEARQVTEATSIQLSKPPQNELISATVTRTAQVLQSLMAEFSLMWLLFLGVFMVVVSSGVLAASQWRQFTPQGQYLILLGYTLAFWVASARIGQRENLRLTAQMLKIATLLIIPVNFWMIDSLKLWRSGVGLAIALCAAVVLTTLTIRLLKSTTNTQHQQLILINSVGLSWLHWGWSWTGFPIMATYIGTVGTAFSLFHQYQGNNLPSQTSRNQVSLAVTTVTAATLLLLTRAIFVVKIPISQLGLAIAISGWLCCWLSQRNYTQESQEISNRPLNIAGVVLLLIGWLVCVTTIPLQAIAISGLGLWLLFTRLRRRWQFQDLSAIFLVGLQLFWLLWRLIPTESRQNLLSFCLKIAGTAFMPKALLSVALFPYVLLTLFFAARLRRWQQPNLANQAKVLALLLGVVLTSLSLLNPLVRSLNLLLSSLTLAFVTQGATVKTKLIYGTHITSLVAIASGINLFFPNLGIRAWTGILLGIMVAEWSFSVGSNWRSWRRSAWFIGLGLAAISYVLLLREFTYSKEATGWSLIGLLIPITLTAIASKPQFFQQQLASWLSVGGLCLLQLLTFNSVPRLTSLGIATIVMLLNTRQLQQLLTAAIAVGFGLAFSIVAIWQIHPPISLELFTNIVAIAPLGLWLLPLLSKRRTTLGQIYTQATDSWAITIASLYLIVMSLYDLFFFTTLVSRELLLADLVITIAIAYRTFLKPTNLGFYGIAWSLEVLVAAIATQSANSLVNLAIANLALGLTIQITRDWWVRSSSHNYRSSWHIIPLIYAVSACLLQHLSFTASSGLFTLGAALIGIGIGRRHQHYKFLIYFSLLSISIAAYELVIYQLLQVPNSSLSDDGLVILAVLGTLIAICYYLFAPWLVPYLRLTKNELDVIADLHWAISSGFVGLALLSSPSFGAVLVTTILAIYALIQGRSSENWTYAGIIEAVAAFSFLLELAYPNSQWLVAWSSAIASIFAFGVYSLPWNTWGWSLRPWRRAAYVLPGLFICLSISKIAIQSLLIAAAVYAWFAKDSGKVRLSYVSIVLADWAIARLFRIYGLDEPLWYATLLGSSLLYVTQVEPALQASTEKEKRHLLRCLATGLICLTALYQAEANLFLGLLTIGFSIGFILTGLALRIRAFLYIGTGLFIVQIGRQIWFFIHDYSLTLWAVGIVLGITFIWIAANFESRREQMTSILQRWVTELEDWD